MMRRRDLLLGLGAATIAGAAEAQTGVWGTSPHRSSRPNYSNFIGSWSADTNIQNVYVREGTDQVVAVDRFVNGATVFSYIGRDARTGAYSIFTLINRSGQFYGLRHDGYAFEEYVSVLRDGRYATEYVALIDNRTAAFNEDPCRIGAIIPADPYSGGPMTVRQVTRAGSQAFAPETPWRSISLFAGARGCAPSSRRPNMWSPNG